MNGWFANLRLAHKLGIGFGATIALMLGIIGVSIGGMNGVKSQLNWVATRTLAAEESLQRFTYNSSQVRVREYRVAGYQGQQAIDLADQLKDYESKADQALKDYGALVVEPQDRSNFDNLSAAWDRNKSIWNGISRQVLESEPRTAFKLLEKSTVQPYTQELVPAEEKALEWRVSHGKQLANEGLAQAETSTKAIVFAGVIAVVMAAFFGVFITRAIKHPLFLVADRLGAITKNCLAGLTDGLQHFANGDLTVSVTPTTTPVPLVAKDEVGQMAETFNVSLNNLQTAIGCYNEARMSLAGIVRTLDENSKAVAETSQGLAASSEESGAASSEIAGGSEKLAKDATSVAAVTQQLAAQIAGVRNGVREQGSSLASSATEMSTAAKEGNAAVQRTVEAMETVQSKVGGAALKVQELDEKGREIGRIVASIEDIAGQTNLLALNAAIEAARAGEHGRGFAVVADEVRKLAEKAALATQDISALIGGITLTVEQTVHAIEETRLEVEGGARTSEAAGEALTRILAASSEVTALAGTMVTQTDEACEEMSNGANDLARSVSSVAAVSEQSAAGAQELSAGIQEVGAAATELNAMSDQLRDVVNKFVIEDAPKKKLKLAA